jgi:outer membrane protein assembly factor BamE (lipoprotein component of BamABCDE complex)
MKTFIALLLVLFLAACAGGSEFVKPENESLVLGSTTYDQIVKSYGTPRRTGAMTRNGIALRTVSYAYTVAVPFSTKLSSRTMVFVFDDNALVSYDYISSFEDDRDAVNLDNAKVEQLAKGDRKSKVFSILGKPSGEAIYPVASGKGDSIARYSYMSTYRVPFNPNPRITRKVLVLSFDANDIVTDMTSTESKP